MYQHFIIMASSYERGTRIALHFAFSSAIDIDKIESIITMIQNSIYEKSSYSTHVIVTSEKSWESVVEYDAFFADALVLESVEEFVKIMKRDLKINGLDVARYVMTKKKCTHLSLQKLTYLCYADYLCKYNKRLFEDRLFAFQYGPVIESVFEKYKYKQGVLGTSKKDSIPKSRILVLEDGMERIASIDETISKYALCTARDLVNITHAEGAPWRFRDYKKGHQIIEDELILAQHKFEEDYFRKNYR